MPALRIAPSHVHPGMAEVDVVEGNDRIEVGLVPCPFQIEDAADDAIDLAESRGWLIPGHGVWDVDGDALEYSGVLNRHDLFGPVVRVERSRIVPGRFTVFVVHYSGISELGLISHDGTAEGIDAMLDQALDLAEARGWEIGRSDWIADGNDQWHYDEVSKRVTAPADPKAPVNRATEAITSLDGWKRHERHANAGHARKVLGAALDVEEMAPFFGGDTAAAEKFKEFLLGEGQGTGHGRARLPR